MWSLPCLPGTKPFWAGLRIVLAAGMMFSTRILATNLFSIFTHRDTPCISWKEGIVFRHKVLKNSIETHGGRSGLLALGTGVYWEIHHVVQKTSVSR